MSLVSALLLLCLVCSANGNPVRTAIYNIFDVEDHDVYCEFQKTGGVIKKRLFSVNEDTEVAAFYVGFTIGLWLIIWSLLVIYLLSSIVDAFVDITRKSAEKIRAFLHVPVDTEATQTLA